MKKLFLTIPLLHATLFAVNVTDTAELNTALENNTSEIIFQNDITLTNRLFPVNSNAAFEPISPTSIAIDGNGHTLNGASHFAGFLIRSASITISDMHFSGCATKGGNGGNTLADSANGGAGGGGAGMGGGLFIADGANVTLVNPSFSNCTAQGGKGGNAINTGNASGGAGGGGGRGNLIGGAGNIGNGGNSLANGGFGHGAGGGSMLFPGGDAVNTGTPLGGGGAGVGGSPLDGNGENGGNHFGNAGGGLAEIISDATENGAGGAFSSSGDGGDGGYGGGGGGGATVGGTGGHFGGGGGGTFSDAHTTSFGGTGGFGGGGGGGATAESAEAPGGGGQGGFGGGGGGGSPNVGATQFSAGGNGGAFGGAGGTPSTAAPPGPGGGGAGLGGAIFLERGSTLTIQGSASFSSSSTIGGSAGIASTGNATSGQAAGDDIFMMSSSQLTFDLTSDLALEKPIIGDVGKGGGDPNAFGLTKRGSASVTLSGDNTYSGRTRVEKGELEINGSVITPIDISQGATLSGNLTAKADDAITQSGNIRNSGTLSPGKNGAGLISLDGEYTQTSTGTLQVDITPTGLAREAILDAKNASLAGTLEVVLKPGNYIAGTRYMVIDAPTGGTRFETIVETSSLETPIDWKIKYGSVVLTILSTSLFENQNIDAGPACDVANCMIGSDIVPNSDFAIVVETLGTLSDKEVNKALVSLSAVQYGSLEWVNARNNSYAADILSNHLFELCCLPRNCCDCTCNKHVWVTGFGDWMNNTKKLDFLSRYSAHAAGVLAGIDFCSFHSLYYGAAFGYTHTDLKWKSHKGGGDQNSYYGALYGSFCCNYLTIDASVLGGGSDYDLDRRVNFANIHRKAKSDFWGYFVTAHLGFRSNWTYCCSTFEPYGLVDYHYFTRDGFKEKGADSINLSVKSKTQHMLRSEAGMKWYYEVQCPHSCYAPYLGLSWVGEFPLHESKQPAHFTGRSCLINATSYDSSVQLGSPEVGFKWTGCSGFSVDIGYKGLFNSSTRINQLEGTLSWIF